MTAAMSYAELFFPSLLSILHPRPNWCSSSRLAHCSPSSTALLHSPLRHPQSTAAYMPFLVYCLQTFQSCMLYQSHCSAFKNCLLLSPEIFSILLSLARGHTYWTVFWNAGGSNAFCPRVSSAALSPFLPYPLAILGSLPAICPCCLTD